MHRLLDHLIGRMPIHEIEPTDALAESAKIEKRGKLESARRTFRLERFFERSGAPSDAEKPRI